MKTMKHSLSLPVLRLNRQPVSSAGDRAEQPGAAASSVLCTVLMVGCLVGIPAIIWMEIQMAMSLVP